MWGRYDAIIVGSGPNGLAAAIFLQQKGLKTVVLEQSAIPGGAVKTFELTLPGFKHDIASAIHPLAFDSPFFKTLPLARYSLKWVHPEIPFAHPFIDGSAYACYRSIEETASQLGADRSKYIQLFSKLVNDWPDVAESILGPLSVTEHTGKLLRFGMNALLPAQLFNSVNFREENTRLFFYGAAAHSILPLTNIATASFGLVLIILAHRAGWPFPEGGSEKIIEALVSYYRYLGGEIVLDQKVTDIRQLPEASAYLLDLTPRQLLNIGGTHFSSLYRRRLSWYRYGAGAFKIDWALSEPIPFTAEKCRKAGTVHLGFSSEEIKNSESLVHRGGIPDRPYVLVSQHSVFDSTRAPEGKHTGWAYCHVPNGSRTDMTELIEYQIEKAAPGFKDCILKRVSHTVQQMEFLNPNLIGGDISGGRQDITQLFTRPVARLSPYSTPDPRVYICSSSTPPGGGVHGMCGYHAALRAWNDHFR